MKMMSEQKMIKAKRNKKGKAQRAQVRIQVGEYCVWRWFATVDVEWGHEIRREDPDQMMDVHNLPVQRSNRCCDEYIFFIRKRFNFEELEWNKQKKKEKRKIYQLDYLHLEYHLLQLYDDCKLNAKF